MLPRLPPLDARWYENRSRGLVFTQSPTELTFRLYFPETVGRRQLEIFRLLVDARAGHCVVVEPFFALFGGDTRSFFFADNVLFSSIGGFDREDEAKAPPAQWIAQNVRAAEALLATIEERRAYYRDEHLPNWDLKSGVFEKMVKDYKFHQRELGTPTLAAAEFCRRFADNETFKQLFHPEISARLFFEK